MAAYEEIVLNDSKDVSNISEEVAAAQRTVPTAEDVNYEESRLERKCMYPRIQ